MELPGLTLSMFPISLAKDIYVHSTSEGNGHKKGITQQE